MHRRILPVVMAAASSVFGAEITWEGQGADNDMNIGSNWSSDSVPSSADDAIFDSTVPGVAANPTEDTTTFSALTLQFPGSASLFTLNFNNQTLTLAGGGITGSQTNTTINAANLNNDAETLTYQIYFSDSATSASASLNITNMATLSGSTSGDNPGQITSAQLYSSLPFTVGTGGSISVTNQGSDATTGTGNNSCLADSQAIFSSNLILDGNNTIAILNSAENSGSKSGTSEVSSFLRDQFFVGGDFSSGENLNITTTNSGTDSSTGTVGNYVAAFGSSGDQFYISGTTTLANQASITLINSGTYTGSSTSVSGSSIASLNNQIVFHEAFIAAAAFSLDVSNTGTSSASSVVGNDGVGSLNGSQVSFNASAAMGNDATITIQQQGTCSNQNTTYGDAIGASPTGSQLSVTGAFSAGNNFSLSLENSGIRTGLVASFGSDSIAACFSQSSFGNSCALGNNATIAIENSGQNSSSSLGGNTIGYVGAQMTVQDAFTAMNDLTMTISNSAREESSGTGASDYVGSSTASQLAFLNTFTAQENGAIQITNSGTCISSDGGNHHVADISNDQVEFGGAFSVGSGFLLNVKNTGVDSSSSTQGNSPAVIGGYQALFNAGCVGEEDLSIEISNNGTNSGSTEQSNSVAWVENCQFYLTDSLNATDHFSLSITNTGLDNSTGYGENSVGYINEDSQIGIGGTLTVGNYAAITVSNEGVNSGSLTANGNNIAYVQNNQAYFVGAVRADDYFQLSATNSGVDSSSSPTQDLIGVIYANSQVQPQNSFEVGSHATITCVNSGVNSSNSPSALVGCLGDSQFYMSGSFPFIAGDDLNLEVTNSGNDHSTSTGGNYVGALQGGVIGVQMGCNTFQAGNNATIAISNEGISSGSGSSGDSTIGLVTSRQLYISGASFQAGNDLNMTISNSGIESSTGMGGNNVGYVQIDSQVNCAGQFVVGNNGTMTITNSGTASGSSVNSNTVGFVENYQLAVQGVMTAGDDFTLSVENSGANSSTGTGSYAVGFIASDCQMQCLSTLTVGDNATITVANSGTNTSSTTGNTVGIVGGSQFAIADAFQAGENLMLSVTNTGVNSGNADNVVGSVGASQIAFSGSCTLGDGAYIQAINQGLGLIGGSQIVFGSGLTITGQATFEASNEGTVQDYGISIAGGSGGDVYIQLKNAPLYISSGASTFTIGALNGSAPTVQSLPTLIIDTDSGVSAVFTGSIENYPSHTSILQKMGSGSQTLSGTQTYGGLTTIAAGELTLLGSLAAGVQIDLGATFSGNGTIAGAVTNAGTIAPGQSIGTLQMASYNGAGNYDVEVNGSGQSDLIDVTGAADITGGTVSVTAEDGVYLFQTPYTIVHAGTLSGSGFTNVTASFPFSIPRLTSDAHNVYLTFTTDIAKAARTANERAVANQLDGIVSPTPQQSVLLSEMASLSASQLTSALDSVSGWQYTSNLTLAEMTGSHFLSRLYDAVRSIVTNPGNCCCDRWTLWGEAGYTHTHITGNKNSHGLSLNGGEGTFGAQTTRWVDWTFGVAGSFEWDTVSYKHCGGSSDNNTLLVGLYSLYRPSRFYGLFDIAYGYRTQAMKRALHVGNLYFTAHGKPHISQMMGYNEWGVDFSAPHLLIQPFIGIKGSVNWENHIVETCSGGWALNQKELHRVFGSSRLGLHFTAIEIPGNISISLDAAWNYRFPNNQNFAREHFVEFGDEIRIRGVTLNQNSFDYALTFSRCITGCYSFFLEYSGEVYNKALTYDVSGGLSFCW